MSSSIFRVQHHTLPSSYIREYPRALADEQDDDLLIAINQYTPLQNTKPRHGDVTIIGVHANGFPKELYEPLWDELHSRLEAKGIHIRNIWIADVAQQGASGVLNEKKLGSEPSWMDHPRDLFLMINHFRKQMSTPLIGIGHSMGGCQLVNLAIMHPRLFTTLVLIDPVIARISYSHLAKDGPAIASTFRRDRWPSRKAAEALFRRSKFYQAWDPRVLDLWIKYGLRDLPTAVYPDATVASDTTERQVTLTTPKHQEVFTFLRANFPTESYPDPPAQSNPNTHPDVDTRTTHSPFYNSAQTSTFYMLQHLRPSVLYVFGDQSNLSAPLLKADKLAVTGVGVGGSGGIKAGRVKEVTFKGIGHLIPMEIVDETADACTDWLVPELERWQQMEEAERVEWMKVPKEKKALISDEYMRFMGNGSTKGSPTEPVKSSKL